MYVCINTVYLVFIDVEACSLVLIGIVLPFACVNNTSADFMIYFYTARCHIQHSMYAVEYTI
jgi:hypothetical protein